MPNGQPVPQYPGAALTLEKREVPIKPEVHAPSIGNGMRLLIVEDSALVRRMYGLVFPRREHEMIEADDGQTALTALAASPRPFDVILLDLRMPGMDGVGFIRAVREDPEHRTIPIIVTTSEPESSELLQQAKALGVAGVMKKPWKPQELLSLVQFRAAAPELPIIAMASGTEVGSTCWPMPTSSESRRFCRSRSTFTKCSTWSPGCSERTRRARPADPVTDAQITLLRSLA
jgi:two-component system chemotaxis response regulator CheY